MPFEQKSCDLEFSKSALLEQRITLRAGSSTHLAHPVKAMHKSRIYVFLNIKCKDRGELRWRREISAGEDRIRIYLVAIARKVSSNESKSSQGDGKLILDCSIQRLGGRGGYLRYEMDIILGAEPEICLHCFRWVESPKWIVRVA